MDVIISNCVINLSPDKPAVLREAYRALADGGEVYFSGGCCVVCLMQLVLYCAFTCNWAAGGRITALLIILSLFPCFPLALPQYQPPPPNINLCSHPLQTSTATGGCQQTSAPTRCCWASVWEVHWLSTTLYGCVSR